MQRRICRGEDEDVRQAGRKGTKEQRGEKDRERREETLVLNIKWQYRIFCKDRVLTFAQL